MPESVEAPPTGGETHLLLFISDLVLQNGIWRLYCPADRGTPVGFLPFEVTSLDSMFPEPTQPSIKETVRHRLYLHR